MNDPRPWASKSPTERASPLGAIEEGLPIKLIATSRDNFCVCGPDEVLQSVHDRNTEHFDFLPVVDINDRGGERIVGLLDLDSLVRSDRLSGGVRECMLALSEDTLIGADASILGFVRDADRHGCRFVVSGAEISGLVTLSDLQQLPVRAALFGMLTHLEITMADAIRRNVGGPDHWMPKVSDKRQTKIGAELAKAQLNNTWIDPLHYTQFCDKSAIICKSERFGRSKSKFQDEFSSMMRLRDNIAHSNEFAASREAAISVCETVRLADRWIETLSAWKSD